jgi:hypothetical protein
MSDGPHRSLPMGRRWKKLAECLDNPSFSAEDLRERRDAAILGEFAREVSESMMAALRNILCNSEQGMLFAPTGSEVENLRSLSNGSPVGGLLLDCAIDAVDSGYVGEAALSAACSDTASELFERHSRGMAEHFQREAGAKRAADFQSRLDSLHDGNSMTNLTSRIVQGGRALVVRPPTRHSGLEDGVAI